MRLSAQTDFALRTLMFLAARPGHHSIAAIADGYGISRNHLMKVAQRVVAEGFAKSVRGRGGGLMLARDSNDINVGAVVRTIEDFGAFVECFQPLGKGCVVTPVCGLRHVLAGGLEAFLKHLDRFTVADLVADPAAFSAALRPAEPV
ncbi:MAG: Rrf2 family transcriptional regulator [Sphingomicrobium sp.]